MNYIKAFTVITFAFLSIFMMINEFFVGYDKYLIKVDISAMDLLKAWYGSSPLWVTILWAISAFLMIVFFVLPYILSAQTEKRKRNLNP